MSTKETGGPAFPCSENGTSHTIAMAEMLKLPETASTDEKDKVYIQTKANAMQGMSLRDYFAAQAVAGMFSPGIWPKHEHMLTAAKSAYLLADAMLAARSA